uniref:SBP-type domain-containing protein n=1 Tax=Plectus sambesii TaxID=2011161 RepID=A0A914X3L7_9BILA
MNNKNDYQSQLCDDFVGRCNTRDVVAAVHVKLVKEPAGPNFCRFCAHHDIKQELAGHGNDCYFKRNCTTPRCERLRAGNKQIAGKQKARNDGKAIAPQDAVRIVAGRGEGGVFVPVDRKNKKDKHK